jgi:hypothetical protein
MRQKRIVSVFILLLYVSVLYGWDDANIDLRIEMANVSRSAPPALRHRTVLFTYHQPSYVRYVGIAFDFENFQIIHPYRRNAQNVFVFPFEVPEGFDELKYRIVVDGLWMPDPLNPDHTFDHKGNLLSRFTFKLPEKTILASPVVKSDGTVEFNLRYSSGGRVFLTGDFTNWEPFMIEMDEISPGIYGLSRRFPPGSYEYCFIVGGARTIDPLNPLYGTDPHGYLASHFTVR